MTVHTGVKYNGSGNWEDECQAFPDDEFCSGYCTGELIELPFKVSSCDALLNHNRTGYNYFLCESSIFIVNIMQIYNVPSCL